MFYFNLSGRTPFADVDGQNLPSIIDAMQEAMGMAQDLARNKRAREISGGSGREVFRMPLIGMH
jgi:hypothetical protein